MDVVIYYYMQDGNWSIFAVWMVWGQMVCEEMIKEFVQVSWMREREVYAHFSPSLIWTGRKGKVSERFFFFTRQTDRNGRGEYREESLCPRRRFPQPAKGPNFWAEGTSSCLLYPVHLLIPHSLLSNPHWAFPVCFSFGLPLGPYTTEIF